MKASQMAMGGIGFLGIAMLVAWRSPQDSDLTKRMERIEQRLVEFQGRLERLEKLNEIERRATEARGAATKALIRNLQTALSMYEIDNGRLPTTEQGLRSLVEKPTAAPVPTKWVKYLDDEKALKDFWGREFVYRFTGKDEVGYELFSTGPDGKPGTDDDIRNK